MKKIICYIAGIAGGVLLLAILVVGSGYLWSLRETGPLTVPGVVELLPSGPAELGRPVKALLRFELPVSRSVLKADAVPGAGSTLSGGVKIERGDWKWSRQEWRLTFQLRAFHDGTIPPGALSWEVSGAKPELFTAVIPDFSVKAAEVAPGATVELADAVELRNELSNNWLFWLVLLPFLLAGYYLWRRHGKGPEAVPPWERALAAIQKLRDELSGRKIPLEQGFVRLTDLVRGYLEQRFEIAAPTRTTPEFLSDLDNAASPLPKEQRPFLRDFMIAADQVKFAKAAPDDRLLTEALTRAEQLVESTRVEKEEGGAK